MRCRALGLMGLIAVLASSGPAAAAASSNDEGKAKASGSGITLTAVIDLTHQRLTLSGDGVDRQVWPISSGRSGYATPAGSFKPSWTARSWFSKKYDDAPMPYSVFFNGGIATHGTQATGLLGSPASHGCVRLSVANAQTFYNLVQQHGLTHTRIQVTGEAPVREDRVASRARTDGSRVASNEPLTIHTMRPRAGDQMVLMQTPRGLVRVPLSQVPSNYRLVTRPPSNAFNW